MANIPSFYAQDTNYSNFINIRYMLDIEIEKFLADKLFFGDVNRIVVASNEQAFRARGRQYQGDYHFPFLNYWMTAYEYSSDFGWYNMVNEKQGVWIPESDINVRLMPLLMEYEASFWCNRTDEMQYALKELLFEKNNHTALQTGFTFGDSDIQFIGIFNILDLEPNPEYTDADWLERNKISSIGMNFSVIAYDPKLEGSIGPIEKVIFDFAARITGSTDWTFTEAFEIVKNKISGEIEVTQVPVSGT